MQFAAEAPVDKKEAGFVLDESVGVMVDPLRRLLSEVSGFRLIE